MEKKIRRVFTWFEGGGGVCFGVFSPLISVFKKCQVLVVQICGSFSTNQKQIEIPCTNNCVCLSAEEEVEQGDGGGSNGVP